ncbi:hypothetical protein L226DRAFT_273915 [Lentinus tigrinus ALCF2SS1-7]|uniref:uncharacterized protein n=1 Tax=Lentinus tigrinus ALCF2SS1-7 TaxID=1328758 RepID=UPI001165E58E|nr:hypothetical protein L226DRAFT_273915 [Lentinus tigrinus ALCF2SS1-7]
MRITQVQLVLLLSLHSPPATPIMPAFSSSGSPSGADTKAILIGVFVGLGAILVIIALITIAIRRRRRDSESDRLPGPSGSSHPGRSHPAVQDTTEQKHHTVPQVNVATVTNVAAVNASLAASQHALVSDAKA